MSNIVNHKVVCECGHAGEIVHKENDTPYSSTFWESYSLKNLNGNTNAGGSNWEDIFRNMRIACPKCNTSLTPNNLINK